MSDSPYPSQTQDKFVLRLPDGMRDRIKAAAEANNRSMNAEIVATLEEKYPPPAIDTGSLLSRWKDLLDEFSEIADRYRESTDQATADYLNREMDRIEQEIEDIKVSLRPHL